MADRAEQLLEAVDVLFSQRIKSINFDSTIVCTIVDASKAELGQYTVSDGSVKFVAYSKETDFKNEDQVLVTIPNGDYNQQKIIVSKYIVNQNEPYTYVSPFSTMIDITGNQVIGDQGVISLYANHYQEYATVEREGATSSYFWEEDFSNKPIVGYNRLGIQAQFSTWLSSYKVVSGNYGLGLRVDYDSDSLEADRQKEIVAYQKDKETAIYNVTNNYIGPISAANDAGNDTLVTALENARDEQIAEITNRYDALITEVENREIASHNYYFLDSTEDFYGNVYNFDSYFQQEAVFDITDSQNKKIIKLSLFFYQRRNFIRSNGQYVPAPTFTLADLNTAIAENNDIKNLSDYYEHLAAEPVVEVVSNQIPNLYMKEPYICFGYNVEGFDTEDLILYTGASATYNATKTDEENNKVIELRWVHKKDDKTWSVTTSDFSDTTDFDNYIVRWYRYKLGAPSPDEYAGVFWEILNSYSIRTILPKKNNSEPNSDFSQIFTQTFIPDTTVASESIKAILIKDGGAVARSNILIFENEQEVINKTQADITNALSIVCGLPAERQSGKVFDIDTQNGSFFLYQKGNELMDESKSKELFSLSLNFNSLKNEAISTGSFAPLTEASVVIWSFPASNSMIRPVYGPTGQEKQFTFLSKKDISNNVFTDNVDWFSNPDHIRYTLLNHTNTVDTKIFYNSTLDTIEILHFGNAITFALNTDTESPDSIFGRYFIDKTYSPAKVNNTIRCEVVKDRLRYTTTRQLLFGQSGTSGSDYTIVLDWRNNQNVITVSTPTAGNSSYDYSLQNPYYAMVPTVRLVGQDGCDVLDFTNIDETAQVHFSISQSEAVEGSQPKVTPNETADIFYPVLWNNTGDSEMDALIQNLNNFESSYCITEDWEGYTVSTWPLNTFYCFVVDKYGATNVDSILQQDSGTFHPVTFAERAVLYDNYKWFYRKLRTDGNNPDALRPKVVYEKKDAITSEANYNAQAEQHLIFINYEGVYVVDPFGAYNEAQQYFEVVSDEATQDSQFMLECVSDDPESAGQNLPQNSKWIRINPNYQFNNNVDKVNAIMNSLSILKVTITGFGDYDLETYYPIPLRRKLNDKEYLALTGATTVQYGTDGSVPAYYKNPYSLTYLEDGVIKESVTDEHNQWKILIPTATGNNIDEKLKNYAPTLTVNNILQPLPMYIPGAPLTGVQYIHIEEATNTPYWTQPILIYQDNYPSTTINKWDGKSVDIDESTGTILTSAIAAGKKEKNNTFSGVMLGDWSRTDTDAAVSKQTGLYGFNRGAMSYAFKQDGTGFIGKDGSGRIYFSGDKAQIYSSDWINKSQGMLLDLDDGYMKLVKKSAYSPITFLNRLVFRDYLDDPSNLTLCEFKMYDVFSSYNEFNSAYGSASNSSGNAMIYYPSAWASLGLNTIAANNIANGNLVIPDNHSYYNGTITNQSNRDLFTYPEGQNYILLESTELGGDFTPSQIIEINNAIDEGNGHELGETYSIHEAISVENGYQYDSEYTGYKKIRFRRYQRDNQAIEELVVDEHGDYILEEPQEKVVKIYQRITSKYIAIDPAVQSELTTEYCNNHDIYRPILYSLIPSIAFDSNNTRFQLENSSGNWQQLQPYYFKMLPESDRYIVINANTPFSPFALYYQRANIQGNRYVTIGVNETLYPMSIGQDAAVGSRRFRVTWDGKVYITDGDFSGNINAKSGQISGDLDVYGTLTGGSFYTDQLYAHQGQIGGWHITNSTLYGGDTVLHSSTGIYTTDIHIKATGSADSLSSYGGMGYIGADFTIDDDEQEDPGVGMYYGSDVSSSPAIYKVTPKNIGFKWYGSYMTLNMSTAGALGSNSGTKVWSFNGNNNTKFNIQNMSEMNLINMSTVNLGTKQTNDGSVTFTIGTLNVRASNINFETPAATNQTGIYARFAPAPSSGGEE